MDSGENSYRRFLDGDDNGIVELVRDYKDGLILYLFSYVKNMQTAEDLAQETFLKIAVDRPRFHGRSSFKTWLFTIGQNKACDYIRKISKRKNVSIDECFGLESDTDIELECLLDEQKMMLYKSINKLNDEYRQSLVLSYFEGFDNAEIAKIMHKNKRQIESLLYNARKSLKKELERSGFQYEEL